MSYQTQVKVRFGHCDPAGIVYFPRYYEMLNGVVEDWFAERIGFDFRALHGELQSGVPTAHIETDFKAPSRLGDWLTFELKALSLGRASLALSIGVHCGDELRLHYQSTLVCVDMRTGKAMRWPDALAQRLTQELEQGTPS
ncbi:MAG: acyl-CoA thioesterase [Saccharospirillum sp.]|nr:acyl-CoA thioesterase [Saccharospirillum sp.]